MALVAAFVALAVAAVSTAIVLTSGSIGSVEGIAAIAGPALAGAIAASIATHLVLVRRLRKRERASNRKLSGTRRRLQDEKTERSFLRELDAALDASPHEAAAVASIEASFANHLSMQPMELHLVDPVDPVLNLVVATGDHETRPSQPTSPWDSVAGRTNTTLIYGTTDRVDTCPHLRSRLEEPISAVAVPVNVMGQMLGVLYGFGPDRQEPGVADVRLLEDLGRLIGSRIAILRATAGTTETTEHVDRLTGLPDRSAMQERVLRMLRDRQPFAVAVADIDNFSEINATHGRDHGDRALQLLGQVARRTIRPSDVVGRIGGDEFLFVMPRTDAESATRAFERLREELVLAQAEYADLSFSISIGVISSGSADTIEEILHRAAGALDHARTQGGNRVVIATTARQGPAPR